MLNGHKAAIADLDARLCDQQAAITRHQDLAVRNDIRAADQDRTIAEQGQLIADHELRLADHDRRNADLKTHIDNITHKIETAIDRISTFDAASTELSTRLNRHNDRIETLERSLELLIKKVDQGKSENEMAHDLISTLSESIKKDDFSHERLRLDVAALTLNFERERESVRLATAAILSQLKRYRSAS